MTLFILLLQVSLTANAVKIYQCEDEQGQVSFEAHCPPGTTQLEEKNFKTRPQPAKIVPTVYFTSNCPACDAVSKLFQAQGITVEKKNIENNVDLQNELKEKTGNLKVPTVIIGGKIITDYDQNKLTKALAEAGLAGKTN
ncbi:MAG: glutaredoxin domain-containing protein [Gammaproteobacteria bacterium]